MELPPFFHQIAYFSLLQSNVLSVAYSAGSMFVSLKTALARARVIIINNTLSEIDIDDLQECVDDCPKGKRTKENMRAVCGLVYKYGIPRKVIPDNLNLATFLIIDGEGAAHRESFTEKQIENIKKACGKVPHAEDVYCMIYT